LKNGEISKFREERGQGITVLGREGGPDRVRNFTRALTIFGTQMNKGTHAVKSRKRKVEKDTLDIPLLKSKLFSLKKGRRSGRGSLQQ